MERFWLIGGGAILVVLLVASVVVALASSEEEFAPGSPEATVQTFLRAMDSEDFQVAYDTLSSEIQGECSAEALFGVNTFGRGHLEDARITLEDTQTLDSTTFVDVRIAQFYGSGPLGSSESAFQQRFSLGQFDGDWRFTDYPWPLFRCGPFKPVPAEPVETPTPTPEPPQN